VHTSLQAYTLECNTLVDLYFDDKQCNLLYDNRTSMKVENISKKFQIFCLKLPEGYLYFQSITGEVCFDMKKNNKLEMITIMSPPIINGHY